MRRKIKAVFLGCIWITFNDYRGPAIRENVFSQPDDSSWQLMPLTRSELEVLICIFWEALPTVDFPKIRNSVGS